MIALNHILCPVDVSETSARALTYAAAFATWYDVQLTVLHVVPAFDEPPAVDAVLDARRRREGQRAAASNADLIVMGAQGSRGIELMLYGSNTHHVVRAATCPVLTVRA